MFRALDLVVTTHSTTEKWSLRFLHVWGHVFTQFRDPGNPETHTMKTGNLPWCGLHVHPVASARYPPARVNPREPK